MKTQQNNQSPTTVARATEILVGLKCIGDPFGVGNKTVRAWKEQGAPIYCGKRGIYRAEIWELWEWVKVEDQQ